MEALLKTKPQICIFISQAITTKLTDKIDPSQDISAAWYIFMDGRNGTNASVPTAGLRQRRSAKVPSAMINCRLI